MNIVLLLIVVSVLAIDFFSMHKHDLKTTLIYLSIVSLIIAVTILDKYDILEMSPVEMIIDTITPLVEWISENLRSI